MNWSRTFCICLYTSIMLVVSYTDARHLTDRKSDAATRLSALSTAIGEASVLRKPPERLSAVLVRPTEHAVNKNHKPAVPLVALSETVDRDVKHQHSATAVNALSKGNPAGRVNQDASVNKLQPEVPEEPVHTHSNSVTELNTHNTKENKPAEHNHMSVGNVKSSNDTNKLSVSDVKTKNIHDINVASPESKQSFIHANRNPETDLAHQAIDIKSSPANTMDIENGDNSMNRNSANGRNTESRNNMNDAVHHSPNFVTPRDLNTEPEQEREQVAWKSDTEAFGDWNAKSVNPVHKTDHGTMSLTNHDQSEVHTETEHSPNEINKMHGSNTPAVKQHDHIEHSISQNTHNHGSTNQARKQSINNHTAFPLRTNESSQISDISLTSTWNNQQDISRQTEIVNGNKVTDISTTTQSISGSFNNPEKRNYPDTDTENFNSKHVAADKVSGHMKALGDTGSETKSNTFRPRITVLVEEKNSEIGHAQQIFTSNGQGIVRSRKVHVSGDVSSDVLERNNNPNHANVKHDESGLFQSQEKTSVVQGRGSVNVHNSGVSSPVAVLERAHDLAVPQKHVLEPAESNAESIHDISANAQEPAGNQQRTTSASVLNSEETTTQRPETRQGEVDGSDLTWIHSSDTSSAENELEDITTTERVTEVVTPIRRVPESEVTSRREPNGITPTEKPNNIAPTERAPKVVTPKQRRPEDVEPLTIFTNDIKYQRFPRPMSYTTLKNKVLGKPLKKLYILEESDTKLFQHVRQLEAVYTVEDGTLYVSLLFRFVYSRRCQRIRKFQMGKLVGNTDLAMFEKETKDGKTERVLFFSERPDDYVFFMSCTDMNTSPYACRDSYYITLDSTHDPPNQFPWGDAARELQSKMDLTFEDPRFIFNFVLLPCAKPPPRE